MKKDVFLWWWWWLIWHLVPLESCWFQTKVEPPLMSNSPQRPLLYSGYIPNRDLQSCHTDQNFPFILKFQKFSSQSQSRQNLLITLHQIMMSKPRRNIIIACVAGAHTTQILQLLLSDLDIYCQINATSTWLRVFPLLLGKFMPLSNTTSWISVLRTIAYLDQLFQPVKTCSSFSAAILPMLSSIHL